jgi:hypothetical protein
MWVKEIFSATRFCSLRLSFLILANSLVALFLLLWKSPHSEFGDDGIYVAAGQRLVNRDELYIDGFRSGPFGAFFLFTLSKFFPPTFAWFCFQVIYVLSVCSICILVTRNQPPEIRLLICLFSISAAPFREHLHNHQISALVVFMSLWPFLIKKNSKALWLPAAVSCAAAIDLKPQLSLVIVVALVIYSRRFMVLISTVILLIISHSLISFYLGENITFQWLTFLLKLNPDKGWGESIYFWPLLEKVGIGSPFLHILEYVTILVALISIFVFAYFKKLQACLIVISILTYLFNYSHFYDMILLSILVAASAFARPNIYTVLFMSFAIMPGGVFEFSNLLFWTLFLSVYLFSIKAFSEFTLAVAWIPGFLFAIELVTLHLYVTQNEQVRFRSTIYICLAMLALNNGYKRKLPSIFERLHNPLRAR